MAKHFILSFLNIFTLFLVVASNVIVNHFAIVIVIVLVIFIANAVDIRIGFSCCWLVIVFVLAIKPSAYSSSLFLVMSSSLLFLLLS